MLARRELLIGGVMGGGALALLPSPLRAAALPVPLGNRLGFDVLRKGSQLGTHVVSFAQAGNRLTVHVEVSLIYKLLGITIYHYTHHCTESWEGSEVVTLDCRTNDNGTAYEVSAKREAGGLVVQASGQPRYTAPAGALPATHWNQRELDGPWINTQNGKLARPRVTAAGNETIPAAGGRALTARRFDLSGDVKMAMWYDRQGWAGLSFDRGGAPIRYERQA
jgi:hypothetical protein